MISRRLQSTEGSLFKNAWLVALALLLIPSSACDDGVESADASVLDVEDQSDEDASGQDTPNEDVLDDQGPVLRFDPGSDDFFALPLPSDARRRADGSLGFVDWPRAYQFLLTRSWLDTADELLDGWGLLNGVFVYLDAPIDPETLPTDAASSIDLDDGWPSVALVDVDPASPDRGELRPITCKFTEAEGSFHASNQLACISPLSIVRRPNRLYALVVTRGLADVDGHPVHPDAAMSSLLDGIDVEGLHGTIDAAPYEETAMFLENMGLPNRQIAGLALFTTGDPTARFRRIADWYETLPVPELDEGTTIEHTLTYDDYIVLEGHYSVPMIQDGSPPYDRPPDGKIVFDEDGEPVVVDTESIRFFLTIPKSGMPDGGWPLMLYFHGSGGVAEQLLDRGRQEDLDTPPPLGSGPAANIAPYGVAGFATDFPLHGTRHDPPDTTGLLLYNVINNPRAMIDNFIIASCEVGLHTRFLAQLEIDPAVAPDFLDPGDAADGLIRFDTDRFSFLGQSMGSTLGLPAMTINHELDAAVLGGSGGALLEIAVASQDPIPIAPTVRVLLRYRDDEDIDIYDPLLNALQQVFDMVDPIVHARHVFLEPYDGVAPKNVFQPSGLTDAYFSPDSRAALAGAMGLELAQPVLEPSAIDLLAWAGHGDAVSLPVSENAANGVTGISVQYEPSVSDGHYVTFQRDDTRAQYACFIWSVGVANTPVFLPANQATVAACESAVSGQ